MNSTFQISTATPEDIPQLVAMINSAYRGDEARKGWTHEADLISGTLRIDEYSLKQILQKPNATILKYTDETGTLVGSVYLDKKADQLYLGMLTVSPDAQAKGIGKQLLKAAEEYAVKHQIYLIVMTVINVRKELIDWYVRHGYTDAGERQPFPDDGRFGMPKIPLEFIVLQKKLTTPE